MDSLWSGSWQASKSTSMEIISEAYICKLGRSGLGVVKTRCDLLLRPFNTLTMLPSLVEHKGGFVRKLICFRTRLDCKVLIKPLGSSSHQTVTYKGYPVRSGEVANCRTVDKSVYHLRRLCGLNESLSVVSNKDRCNLSIAANREPSKLPIFVHTYPSKYLFPSTSTVLYLLSASDYSTYLWFCTGSLRSGHSPLQNVQLAHRKENPVAPLWPWTSDLEPRQPRCYWFLACLRRIRYEDSSWGKVEGSKTRMPTISNLSSNFNGWLFWLIWN